jgi:hypothetical protein
MDWFDNTGIKFTWDGTASYTESSNAVTITGYGATQTSSTTTKTNDSVTSSVTSGNLPVSQYPYKYPTIKI